MFIITTVSCKGKQEKALINEIPPLKLAEFLSSVSREQEACKHRVRAVELSPDDYSLVTSAATALRLLDRKVEAELYYKQVS